MCVLFSVFAGTLLDDEGVGHVAQLLHQSTLLLGQVLHGLLGVKAGPNRPVNLPLVLPRLQRALESLGLRRMLSSRSVGTSLHIVPSLPELLPITPDIVKSLITIFEQFG